MWMNVEVGIVFLLVGIFCDMVGFYCERRSRKIIQKEMTSWFPFSKV